MWRPGDRVRQPYIMICSTRILSLMCYTTFLPKQRCETVSVGAIGRAYSLRTETFPSAYWLPDQACST